MKITVITAAYNSAATIADTLRSVGEQTYPSVEHIIVDGLSSDRTVQIVHEHGAHVARMISERDRGIYDAMNKGLAAASGDVVGLLNSDDLYPHPDVLSRVAASFA